MTAQPKAISLSYKLLVGAVAWQPVTAQPSNTPAIEPRTIFAVEQVVNNLVLRNLERARALGAYQGTRIYRLEYHVFPGSKSAEMTVAVKYRSPETKEFSIQSETGSRSPQQRQLPLLVARYESMPTGACYVLSVEPLTKNKLLYRGRTWVDAKDFAVVRIEAVPAKSPSFWTKETRIEQTYAKVGDFWLPISNRSSSAIRLGGHADFTIDYQDYQITAATPLGTPGDVAGTNTAILDWEKKIGVEPLSRIRRSKWGTRTSASRRWFTRAGSAIPPAIGTTLMGPSFTATGLYTNVCVPISMPCDSERGRSTVQNRYACYRSRSTAIARPVGRTLGEKQLVVQDDI